MADKPLSNEEKRIYRAIVRGTASARESYEIAREAGVRRRESVLRSFRNRTLESDTRRQMKALGAAPADIEREVQQSRRRSVRSVTTKARPRPESFPVRDVEFPRQRYQYVGGVSIQEGEFQGRDTVPVTFGSNRRLTDTEIKTRIAKMADAAAKAYGLRLGKVNVTQKYRTRRKRPQPIEQQARRAA